MRNTHEAVDQLRGLKLAIPGKSVNKDYNLGRFHETKDEA